jgi:hypothetical protein
LELGDTFTWPSPDTLRFYFPTNSTGDLDLISFVAEEVNWISIPNLVGTFGTIPLNSTAADTFTVDFQNAIADQHEPVFELATVEQLGANAGVSQFSLRVVAPVLTYIRQRPEMIRDFTCSGLFNCRQIFGTVKNNGSGIAANVQAYLLLTGGVALITDGLITFGNMNGFSEVSQTTDWFRVDTADSVNARFAIAVTNVYPDGTTGSWLKTNVDLLRPCKPSNVSSDVTRHNSVRVRWDLPGPTCSADLAGFNVYRKLNGAPDVSLVLVSAAPFDSTQFFQDVGPVSDTTYVYRVAAQDKSGNESEYSTAVSQRTWIPLHDGWPQWLDAHHSRSSQRATASTPGTTMVSRFWTRLLTGSSLARRESLECPALGGSPLHQQWATWIKMATWKSS